MTFNSLPAASKRKKKGDDYELESSHLLPYCRSVKMLDYTGHRGGLEKGKTLTYAEIINFEKGSSPSSAPNQNRCVMCGVSDSAAAQIPSQNKNVCRSCDSVPWLVRAVQVVVKFCKGCKNFVVLADFFEKPAAAKCAKCRLRGRNNYRKSTKPKIGGGDMGAAQAEDPFLTEEERDVLFLPGEENLDLPVPDLEEAVCEGELCLSLEYKGLLYVSYDDQDGGEVNCVEADRQMGGQMDRQTDQQPDRGGNMGMGDISISDYSPFEFLRAEQVDLSVSCSSTYNPNCNYNTSRKTDMRDMRSDVRGGMRDMRGDTRNEQSDRDPKGDRSDVILNSDARGRVRRWSTMDCDMVSEHRPPCPNVKKTKANSGPKPPHNNVHFHLPDSTEPPRSISAFPLPHLPFDLSPFLSFCLSETMREAAMGISLPLEPVPSNPPSPQFPSSRPPSSQLVDRWQWDPDSNPLMQLVRATETFAPNSPYKFSPLRRAAASPRRYSPTFLTTLAGTRENARKAGEGVGAQGGMDPPRDPLINPLRAPQRDQWDPLSIGEMKQRGLVRRISDGDSQSKGEGAGMVAEQDNGGGGGDLVCDVKLEIDGTGDLAVRQNGAKTEGEVDKNHDSRSGDTDRPQPLGGEPKEEEYYSQEIYCGGLPCKAEIFAAVSLSFLELSRIYRRMPPAASPAAPSSSLSSSSTSPPSPASSSITFPFFPSCSSAPASSQFDPSPSSSSSGRTSFASQVSEMSTCSTFSGTSASSYGEDEETSEEGVSSDKENTDNKAPAGDEEMKEGKEKWMQRGLRPKAPNVNTKKKKVNPVSFFAVPMPPSSEAPPASSAPSSSPPLGTDIPVAEDPVSGDQERETEVYIPAVALRELEQWYMKWARLI